MNKLLIGFWAFFMSCSNMPSSTSNGTEKRGRILISESQGGADTAGFTILNNEEEFRKIIKGNIGLVELDKVEDIQYPTFRKNQKAVVYNLGTFNSGDHRITEIKDLYIKDDILYVKVSKREPGEMEIQVISKPWLVFTIPSNYQFNSVALIYSK